MNFADLESAARNNALGALARSSKEITTENLELIAKICSNGTIAMIPVALNIDKPRIAQHVRRALYLTTLWSLCNHAVAQEIDFAIFWKIIALLQKTVAELHTIHLTLEPLPRIQYSA
ncbi:MAG: hypothetical protein M0Q41_10785 [Bacteroidales bacterium]|nr:hypothetical protein [Acholeplasmataceae bacterium]MCK9449447.1 hypothetical protein [Bacteroidales bacterium]